MECKIAVISGDGIGPEIVREAKKVLDVVAEKYGHTFNYTDVLMGGASIDVHGIPLPDEAIETAKASDAVVTTSGFYGIIIDITEEDVIVEFGNNKNCRIPMKKEAIAEVEKAQ